MIVHRSSSVVGLDESGWRWAKATAIPKNNSKDRG